MQTVSSNITNQAKNGLRVLKDSQRFLAAFPKAYNAATTFYTIGTSTIGGADLIKGSASVIQEWDKYAYTDYSDRLLDLAWSRELDYPLGGMISAMADLNCDNSDDKFTPGKDPVIGAYMIPKRPIKLFSGFKGEAIPLFIGMNESAPKIDVTAKTAAFHCIDNLQTIYNYPLQTAVMYTNTSLSTIISNLLVLAGLTTSQFSLDTAITVVPFAYFKADDKVGDIIKQLAQSEGGMVFQDEAGVIRYWNREHLVNAVTPLWAFNTDNCYEIAAPDVANIINVVEITSNVRTVQAKQKVWELASGVKIPAGTAVDIFADFKDDFGALPITTLDTPVDISIATTSSFTTNTAQDGSSVPDAAHLTMTSSSLFATAYKMTFTNTGTADLYISAIQLYATPAKVTSQIYVRKQDATSVNIYDEQVTTIANDYIQSEDWANSFAQILLTNQASPTGVRDISVPGIPQLQLGDLVTLDDGSGTGVQNYYVYKISGTINSSGFIMKIRLVKAIVTTYFKIGISTIGGADKIAP